MSKYTTVEGKLFVDIEEAPKVGGITSSNSSVTGVVKFKKAIIKHTFDEEKYPIDSQWIMGEAPGMKGTFFGEELVVIEERNLYARIN